MSLNREQILAAQDLPITSVPLPAWGGEVLVRKMSAADRMRITGKHEGEVKGEAAVKYICEVLVVVLCDVDGKSIMDEADVSALAQKDWDNLKVIADAAFALNGLGPEAIKDAKKN